MYRILNRLLIQQPKKGKQIFDVTELVFCLKEKLANLKSRLLSYKEYGAYHLPDRKSLKAGKLMDQLDLLKNSLTVAKQKAQWATIIGYVKTHTSSYLLKEILDGSVQSLFPDNK